MSFLKNYILDEEFQVNYFRGKINIKNYIKINYMEDTKISISYIDGIIVVHGENLKIIKLLDNEILVDGKIEMVEWK